jgi:hypothetical protein
MMACPVATSANPGFAEEKAMETIHSLSKRHVSNESISGNSLATGD